MQDGPTVKEYARTLDELAECLDLSRKNLTSHWLKKTGWPEKTSKGWDVAASLAYMLAYKQATPGVGGRPGPQTDARAKKLELECQMIQLRMDILKRDYVPLAEYRGDIVELVGYLTDALEEWVGKVGAERRDVELLKWAKDVRDRTRTVLAAKLEAGADEA